MIPGKSLGYFLIGIFSLIVNLLLLLVQLILNLHKETLALLFRHFEISHKYCCLSLASVIVFLQWFVTYSIAELFNFLLVAWDVLRVLVPRDILWMEGSLPVEALLNLYSPLRLTKIRLCEIVTALLIFGQEIDQVYFIFSHLVLRIENIIVNLKMLFRVVLLISFWKLKIKTSNLGDIEQNKNTNFEI